MSNQENAAAAAVDVDGSVLSEWLTQGELASELRVSVDTIRRWSARRIGPPSIKLGARVLYRRETVKDWLRSREKK